MPRRALPRCLGPIIGLLLLLAFPAAGGAAETPGPRYFTLNEQMIAGLETPADPKACDPGQVLGDLLVQLGPTAKVHPTENYFYFQFYRGARSYSGSLRFTLGKRDQGIVEYACYETYVSWLEPDHDKGVIAELSAKDGVAVVRTGHLEYEVAIDGLATRFALNNLDQTPNARILASGERFIGRSFDESGLAFDILYDQKRKAFFFVLDTRDQVTETFVKVSPRVAMGSRTGFVFYEDEAPNRMVLVAAYSEDIFRNSWFDGPFDHLPENFYETNGFWTAVYDAFPELEGKLSPSGEFLDDGMIFAITPYRGYLSEAGLAFIKDCGARGLERADLIVCLTSNMDGAEGAERKTPVP